MYMYAVHLLRANKKLINNVNIVICQFNSSQLNFILDEQWTIVKELKSANS